MSDDEHAVRRSALWRIHGLAAILATPFLLVAAVTGLMYVVAPQVEAWRDRHLDHVEPAPWWPLDWAVQAAQAVVPPGARLRHVVPPLHPGDTVRATFDPPAAAPADGHAGHAGGGAHPAPTADSRFGPRIPRGTIVYVDPGTGDVVGRQAELDRYSTWAKRLHSSLLQGDGWRWMIEWAATCLLVMLVTGAALWWPKHGQAFAPQGNARGRTVWKQWHAFTGFSVALLSLAIVLTGLTWSRYAGDQIRGLRDRVGQAPPRAPKDLESVRSADGRGQSWQAVWDIAQRHAPGVAVQISPPRGPEGVWRVNSLETNGQPTSRFDLVLDAYSGATLYQAGWQDQTLFSKATAIGIPFHRGELGLWNQALLALFGVTVLFSIVTGWVMWFKRRRVGWLGLVALPLGAWRRVSWRWPALTLSLALCALVPLLLLFLLVLLMVEGLSPRTPAPAS